MTKYATGFRASHQSPAYCHTMAEADLDDLDAQIAELQAKKAIKLAKAEALKKIEDKKAKDILIGSTPTKGMCYNFQLLTSQKGR
jgi:hypothetical protein